MEVMLSWYPVKDLAQAQRFYGEVLGLKKIYEMEGWAEFSHAAGAHTIGLAQDAESKETGATVCFRVSDLDEARLDLARKGVQFEGEERVIPGVVRIATCLDPFGHRLQLVQPLQKQ